MRRGFQARPMRSQGREGRQADDFIGAARRIEMAGGSEPKVLGAQALRGQETGWLRW